jgi:hypothetical protein
MAATIRQESANSRPEAGAVTVTNEAPQCNGLEDASELAAAKFMDASSRTARSGVEMRVLPELGQQTVNGGAGMPVA